ncbi:hypothetical protein ACJX0J_037150, partial [Zea mays]
ICTAAPPSKEICHTGHHITSSPIDVIDPNVGVVGKQMNEEGARDEGDDCKIERSHPINLNRVPVEEHPGKWTTLVVDLQSGICDHRHRGREHRRTDDMRNIDKLEAPVADTSLVSADAPRVLADTVLDISGGERAFIEADEAKELLSPLTKPGNSYKRICFSNRSFGRSEDEALDVMRIFSKALEGSVLRYLNISDNALGEKGVRAFSELLKSQESLEELYVMNDGISEEAAKALSELIPATEKLKVLHFHNNMTGDEGNIRQPKYGHLKDLHDLIRSMEKILVHGKYNDTSYGKNAIVTKYTYGGSSVCFINNQFVDRDVKVTLGGGTHLVPAWSVSILPDCKTVAYNTAKIKTQTSVMVKKANSVEKELEALRWSWMPENLKPFMTDHRDSFRQSQLLEQIATSTDQSDYLWYRTSLEHKGEGSYTLYVNTSGHEMAKLLGRWSVRLPAPVSGEAPLRKELRFSPQRHSRTQVLLCLIILLRPFTFNLEFRWT